MSIQSIYHRLGPAFVVRCMVYVAMAIVVFAFFRMTDFGLDRPAPTKEEVWHAVATGDLKTIKVAVRADPGLVTNSGGPCTLLHLSAAAGQTTIAEFLLAKGADANSQLSFKGGTPLHFAASSGQKDMVKWLLAHHAKIDARSDESGALPIHQAATKEVAELLLTDAIGVDVRSNWGETPLHRAAAGGRKAVVEFLLARKASVNVKDNQGITPLVHAAREGVELLLVRGADVNATADYGSTPLKVVASKSVNRTILEYAGDRFSSPVDYKGVVELLLARGATVGPLAEFEKRGVSKDILELLRQHSAPK